MFPPLSIVLHPFKTCSGQAVKKMDRQERNGNEHGDSHAYAEGYLIASLAAEQECHAEQDEINEQQRPQFLERSGTQRSRSPVG